MVLHKQFNGGVGTFGSGSLCRDRPGEVEGVLLLGCTMYIQKHLVQTTQRVTAAQGTPTDFPVVNFDVHCVKTIVVIFHWLVETFDQVTTFCNSTPEAQPAPRVHSSNLQRVSNFCVTCY